MDVRPRAAIEIALILTAATLSISITAFSTAPHFEAKTDAYNSDQRSGAAVYSQMCSRCHGSDGRANTRKGKAIGAADLTSGDWVPDRQRDIRTVTRGRLDMPSFKTKLKPAEIEAVVSYIRRFKN